MKKELMSNWECGADYLNQEIDLGERGEEGEDVYTVSQVSYGACWGLRREQII